MPPPLGDLILGMACTQIAEWKRQNSPHTKLH